ncbi:protein kinase [Paenibacillus sp. UNC499MF]|uniref:protein kinase domain-containing protein n=1 Tax=Paenibacillus sp. UNC499MF TaxID=1502751 RepID=UPI00089FEE84|nr:protein kinase [Paenibacillus sp. UNC499MF]SEG76569.1 serine/threonine protein kinase [Paenibacillus sp. UNC499MF]
MTTSYEPALPLGTTLKGIWNGRTYTVVRGLGSGANGQVLLVRRGERRYAMKIGYDPLDHQFEVNALQSLSKTDTSFSRFLLDADDAEFEGRRLSFFIMPYIQGLSLSKYIRTYGKDWIYVIGSNLLKKLTELHRSGFIYGDLKSDNLVLTEHGSVELIDFGGMTVKGRAVKQFTEIFDRGYWCAGERVAEESYDLFSFAVLIIKTLDDSDSFRPALQALPQNRSISMLEDIVKSSERMRGLAPFLLKALNNRFASSEEALAVWREQAKKARGIKVPSGRKEAPGIVLFLTISLIILLGTIVYFYLE